MKKSPPVRLGLVLLLATLLRVDASYVSQTQACQFTYLNSAYYACIVDYSRGGIKEAATQGFIAHDTSLVWDNQSAPFGRTTHVAYVYNVVSGSYDFALAFQNRALFNLF
ncbi:MAG: hypothetical protein EOL90_13030 [Spartobacteria bacterium]|nr:hypothetical protein [Spartobacteria bacterium]